MTMPRVATSDSNKSAHNNSTAIKSSDSLKDARLCHVVKRPDFDGYGFNLHSEKSKPGQFIGKIDENSPAEAAGLKEGDRIIEVNGLPIGNETHKQVVQRIKAIAWEVKLLVTNENPVDNIAKSPNKFIKQKLINEHNSEHQNRTSTVGKTLPNSVSSDNSNSPSKNSSPLSQHNNLVNSPTVETTNTTTMMIMTPNTSRVSESSKSIESISTESSTPNVNGTLKLPSTAAEMRAILQSKKKYNPKSEDVNIQKKYDIIQKL